VWSGACGRWCQVGVKDSGGSEGFVCVRVGRSRTSMLFVLPCAFVCVVLVCAVCVRVCACTVRVFLLLCIKVNMRIHLSTLLYVQCYHTEPS
jgi:hypothetical protein